MADKSAIVPPVTGQARPSASAKVSPLSQSGSTSPLLKAAGFLKGDRVFDTVKGVEGTVIDAARSASTGVTAILVMLVDGSSVPRHPSELIKRPALPPAKG